MPLDYTAVRKQYDTLYGAGVTKKSMPEWAAEMNELTQSDLYAEGTRDGWWTNTSRWLDSNVFHPVADVTTAPLGEAIGGMFGESEAGRRVGRTLPRTLLETAPLALGPIGIPVVGGLMAAHTYADTGSAKAAAISGVTGAALPLVGRLVERLVHGRSERPRRLRQGIMLRRVQPARRRRISVVGGFRRKAHRRHLRRRRLRGHKRRKRRCKRLRCLLRQRRWINRMSL